MVKKKVFLWLVFVICCATCYLEILWNTIYNYLTILLNQSPSPCGSSRRGMWSCLSARWNASSRFSWLLLDWTSERSTSCGLREHRMARKASPLLQLFLKSFTLTEQPTLKRKNGRRKKEEFTGINDTSMMTRIHDRVKRVWADLSCNNSKTFSTYTLFLKWNTCVLPLS